MTGRPKVGLRSHNNYTCIKVLTNYTSLSNCILLRPNSAICVNLRVDSIWIVFCPPKWLSSEEFKITMKSSRSSTSYCISSQMTSTSVRGTAFNIVPPQEAVCPGAEMPLLEHYTNSKQMVSKARQAGMQRSSDSSERSSGRDYPQTRDVGSRPEWHNAV